MTPTPKKYYVEVGIHAGKIGTAMTANCRDILLRFEDGTENWYGKNFIKEYDPDMSEWFIDCPVETTIDGKHVKGKVSYVGKGYLKIRITEGMNANREVVRNPDTIKKQIVSERTTWRLDFKHGKPGFVQQGNHIADTEAQAFEYLERNAIKNDMTDITLTKIVTRTEVPKPVKIKLSFEY